MRTIAIVGTAPSSRLEVNKEPEEVERWGLGIAWTFLTKTDRWFELHSRGWLLKRGARWVFPYLAWMQSFPGQVYMLERDETVPGSVAYPFDAMVDEFGLEDDKGEKQGYFTSSVAYMLALAIHERPDAIKIFGVDMASEMEYGHQRAGCEYYIGIAKALGIKVSIPRTSPIMKGEDYGRASRAVINSDILQERKRGLIREETVANQQLEYIMAQRAEADRWLDACKNGADINEVAFQARRDALHKDQLEGERRLIGIRSAVQENFHWINFIQGVDDVNDLPKGPTLYAVANPKGAAAERANGNGAVLQPV